MCWVIKGVKDSEGKNLKIGLLIYFCGFGTLLSFHGIGNPNEARDDVTNVSDLLSFKLRRLLLVPSHLVQVTQYIAMAWFLWSFIFR